MSQKIQIYIDMKNLFIICLIGGVAFLSCRNAQNECLREKEILKDSVLTSQYLGLSLGEKYEAVSILLDSLQKHSKVSKIVNRHLWASTYRGYLNVDYLDTCIYFESAIIVPLDSSNFKSIETWCELQFYEDKLYSILLVPMLDYSGEDSLLVNNLFGKRYGNGYSDTMAIIQKNDDIRYNGQITTDYGKNVELSIETDGRYLLKKWEFKNAVVKLVNYIEHSKYYRIDYDCYKRYEKKYLYEWNSDERRRKIREDVVDNCNISFKSNMEFHRIAVIYVDKNLESIKNYKHNIEMDAYMEQRKNAEREEMKKDSIENEKKKERFGSQLL